MIKTIAAAAASLALAGCMASKTEAPKPAAHNTKQIQQTRADNAFNELEKEVSGQGTGLEGMEKPVQVPAPSAEKAPAIPKPEYANRPVDKDNLGPVTKYPIQNGFPVWFATPNMDGYIGAVGIAKQQARGGIAAQRRTAKALAQNDLARSIRVIVNAEVNIEKLNVDTQTLKYYQSKVSTLSRHQAEEVLSDFEIRDEWLDPKTKELYVWLVLRK
ncbi:hypothetical protein EP073_07980 [Geovibrio thiophilus]|uniref:LPP20 lipoprotein n=1 Tax=Geovibrio thiophilus TaxID=139438 RepID=A0A3R5XXR4_9BACT|nr:LPP20 family lipoprotein [Geovibrio thiophilus]QAR33340.1 hypothetical protein EP073_07980 [Geovibrio thiophilus]